MDDGAFRLAAILVVRRGGILMVSGASPGRGGASGSAFMLRLGAIVDECLFDWRMTFVSSRMTPVMLSMSALSPWTSVMTKVWTERISSVDIA